jgi:hypothetical protein
MQCIIADMEFTENDTPEDRALKLRILEIYNKCVGACMLASCAAYTSIRQHA